MSGIRHIGLLAVAAATLAFTIACSSGDSDSASGNPGVASSGPGGGNDLAETPEGTWDENGPSNSDQPGTILADLKAHGNSIGGFAAEAVNTASRVDVDPTTGTVSIYTTMRLYGDDAYNQADATKLGERIVEVYQDMTGDVSTPIYIFVEDGAGALVRYEPTD